MTNTRYVIRNNYSGAYVHKTLFRIRVFQTKRDALRYMRANGLNERYYEVREVDRMIYLDYEKFRQNYLETQRRYDEILSEKEKLFALTQPQAVQFDKEPCAGGDKGSPFDSYLIEKERRRIDERLEEAKMLLDERKELLMQKGQDLRKSTDCHDRIYRMKYIEGWRVIKIATVLGYDKSSVYRILRIISDNIRNKIEVATK